MNQMFSGDYLRKGGTLTNPFWCGTDMFVLVQSVGELRAVVNMYYVVFDLEKNVSQPLSYFFSCMCVYDSPPIICY